MDQIIKVAWDLNENSDNRYKLVYEIAELAKKIVDENQARKAREDFGFEKKAENENLSTVDYIWMMIISSIPVVGMIYLIYLIE